MQGPLSPSIAGTRGQISASVTIHCIYCANKEITSQPNSDSIVSCLNDHCQSYFTLYYISSLTVALFAAMCCPFANSRICTEMLSVVMLETMTSPVVASLLEIPSIVLFFRFLFCCLPLLEISSRQALKLFSDRRLKSHSNLSQSMSATGTYSL